MLHIFLNSLKQIASGLNEPSTSFCVAPDTALAAAGLTSQLGLTWILPSPAQVAAICRSLCSLCQVAPDKTQAVPDLGLHLLGGLRASTLSGQLQITSKHRHQTTSTSNTLKGQTQGAQEPC